LRFPEHALDRGRDGVVGSWTGGANTNVDPGSSVRIGDRVEAGSTVEDVPAEATVEGVVAHIAEHVVLVEAAPQDVVTLIAVEDVVAGAAVQHVVPQALAHDVIPTTAVAVEPPAGVVLGEETLVAGDLRHEEEEVVSGAQIGLERPGLRRHRLIFGVDGKR
jgi:hypothetical protein